MNCSRAQVFGILFTLALAATAVACGGSDASTSGGSSSGGEAANYASCGAAVCVNIDAASCRSDADCPQGYACRNTSGSDEFPTLTCVINGSSPTDAGTPSSNGGQAAPALDAGQSAPPSVDAATPEDAASTKPGNVLLYGGVGSDEESITDAWMFNGTTWTATAAPPNQSGIFDKMQATVASKIAVFSAQVTGSTLTQGTSAFDGTAWSTVAGVQPPARMDGVMASLTGRGVLFGGLSLAGPGLGDTWTFDGAKWAQVLVNGPPGRSEAAMATLGDKIVLFGGQTINGDDPSTILGDTWMFDGTTWMQVASTGPVPRTGHAMASVGGKVVLFGGVDANYVLLDDTWTFDGTKWTQLSVSGPSARTLVSMTTYGSQAVLFGGMDVFQNQHKLGDTWTFNGSHWTQLSVTGPAPRGWAGMAWLP
jgi:hypothetical protein